MTLYIRTYLHLCKCIHTCTLYLHALISIMSIFCQFSPVCVTERETSALPQIPLWRCAGVYIHVHVHSLYIWYMYMYIHACHNDHSMSHVCNCTCVWHCIYVVLLLFFQNTVRELHTEGFLHDAIIEDIGIKVILLHHQCIYQYKQHVHVPMNSDANNNVCIYMYEQIFYYL